ncbi:hypothetical protein ABIB25_005484 [Nakamurella sp. UYEF19]|uniref:hypothetical protein n=1 Tax=Nakamurella sp. UYEF19 TaxID=1756392 RepID=UPI00339A69AA
MAARFTLPFLRGDLPQASQAAATALGRGMETGIPGAIVAHSGHLFCLGWVIGDFSGFGHNTDGLPGPPFVWTAARALALAIAGYHEAGRDLLATLTDDIALGRTDSLHFLGVAIAVEAAFILEQQDVLVAASDVLARQADDHVVLGLGVIDLGPVRRYLALVHARTGGHDLAVRELREVMQDGRSGLLWQFRAALDLQTLTGVKAPQAANGLWSWMAHG